MLETKNIHTKFLASRPHAADISTPLDFRIDAEIPEITRLCLKYSNLSGEDGVNGSFPAG